MKKNYLFLCIFASVAVLSQTKLISFKSHSGNSDHFKSSVYNDVFNVNESNFGVAPTEIIKNAKLDSVIIINDHETILVTSAVCIDRRKPEGENESVWQPGRKTVYNHQLFSKKNVDSVKNVLKRDYHFKNNIDDVVFVEYDSSTKKYQKIKSKSGNKEVSKPEKDKTPKALLFGILMISGLSGFATWKRNRKGNEK
ncbi:hypothetical protein ASG01_04310 [Chryseobacterium sp. Leaf180]|uniref:hypothetical protein n=1 Tax=Chryseobacterium sp. Leaf180 TaxID=1736289 RepID=UPI0007006E22|nr:hypothetical protein [Chryseobacterium sp. Leaf180]KQR95086.1 hypothetical protein ASG01_04310 [Chryseobacterium sp. Leaf180]